ncbi:MAG TPA: TldD/PmbA family protein [Gemmatimonadales bacterium]|nr:TldD/PmbA family protein [Gemmatimonadales bacterium]
MIELLIEEASRRADAADVVMKTDETLTVAFDSGRLKSTSSAQECGFNLRVVHGGRLGFAGSTGQDPIALLDAAFASARLGPQVAIKLPTPAPLPTVRTHSPRAATLSAVDLIQLGRGIVDRLSIDGVKVNLVVERSIGSVRLANSCGVEGSYDVSTVSLSAELVQVRGDSVLITGDHVAAAESPTLAEVEAMVQRLLQRIAWAERDATPPRSGNLPVCFTPAGSAVLLLPLQQACSGKAVLQGISPLGDEANGPRFSSNFTLVDDPLADGRSGSRPMDDEGVPSQRLPLIEQGVVRNFIYDLETAARAGTQPTGHGRRSTFAKPQPAYSNLVVEPGHHAFKELLALIEDGLLVDDLLGVGQGNVIGGAFSQPVGLAYRVVKGEVVGRVKDAAVAGNAYELLGRVAGLGTEAQWIGSMAVPPLLIEGVAVLGA